MTHNISNLYVEKKSAISRLPEAFKHADFSFNEAHTDTITHTLVLHLSKTQSLDWIRRIIGLQFAFLQFYEFQIKERERKIFTHFCFVHNFVRL